MPEPNIDLGSPPGMPRWVKVSAIVVGVLILAVVAALAVGGDHGPGRHGLDTGMTTALR